MDLVDAEFGKAKPKELKFDQEAVNKLLEADNSLELMRLFMEMTIEQPEIATNNLFKAIVQRFES